MDFLCQPQKKKLIRTTLYGDQEFSRWELDLLHTPIMQRLYDLKQLGFTDRIYPDAVHSRFNHVLGAAEMAERMGRRLMGWLRQTEHASAAFKYASMPKGECAEITGQDLAALLERRIGVVRLLGLLHDLTHAAFGHTLEDEVCLFDEKHDDPPRQQRFYDALVAQLLYIWVTELRVREADPSTLDELQKLVFDRIAARQWADEIAATLPDAELNELGRALRDLELAMVLLAHIEFVHQSNHDEAEPPDLSTLFISEIAPIICSKVGPLEFNLHRDVYLIDMVGNTICADLLDYARRDATNAGLKVQFDERLIRYLAVVSVEGELAPKHQPTIRLAIQFFTDKMRHDVLSEMSAVLKARYLINERVLFHPTKCAAGAMLGTSVQLLGMAHLPPWMQALGDQEFLAQLKEIGVGLTTTLDLAKSRVGKDWKSLAGVDLRCSSQLASVVRSSLEEIVRSEQVAKVITAEDVARLQKRVSGGRRVLWRLSARRFPKLVYRLRAGVRHSGGEGDETVAARFCNPQERYRVERKMETLCHLPSGSVVIHCPVRKTSMKVAEVLVVGSDLTRVAKLREVTSVSPEGLEPYQAEILAIERMYLSIWQLHVYLESAWFDKQPVLEWALSDELAFPNDALLVEELASEPRSVYSLLAGEMRGEIPPKSALRNHSPR
ncbi:MAG: hypothetical protein ACLPTQ_25710 [Terriglobales bacterium]